MSDTRFQAGDLIAGRFEVAQAIRGGVGEVYLVFDRQVEQPFALKMLRPRYAGVQSFREAFRREAETWITLEPHPNIVPCEFLQLFNDQPFLVLEWVFSPDEGPADLARRIRHRRLDLPGALRVAVDICRGLLHAAANVPGIVHRDLKPANVLIGREGLARITDFGLAQSAADAGVSAAEDEDEDGEGDALQAAVAGTPRYMAPEQWTGAAVDARTDVYAVGGILFELVSGHSVHAGPALDDFRRQHLTAVVPELADHSAPGAAGAGLRALLRRCLARNIEERPTVAEVLDSLSKIHRDAVGSDPPALAGAKEMSAREWGNRAATFFALKRFDDAIAGYGRAIEIDPNYAYGRASRAAVFIKLGREGEALSDLNRAIEQNPRLSPAYVNRAAVLLARGQAEEALADYDRAIELETGPRDSGPRYPALIEAYVFRARLLDRLGQPERALADYQAATHLDPRNGAAWLGQADTYAHLGRADKADECYTKAIAADGEVAMAYLKRALHRFSAGHDKETMEDASAAIARNPELWHAYLLRGHSRRNLAGQRLDLDLLEGACQDYTRVINLHSTNAEAYISRARLLADAHNDTAAVRDFSQALEIEPGRLDARAERGKAYLDARAYPEAIVDFDHVLAADPNRADVWKWRADAHRKSGAPDEALLDYARALALAEPWPELHVDLAGLLHDLGREEEALAHLNHSVEIDPGFAKAYRVRYQVYTTLGREEEAAQDFVKGLDMKTYEIPVETADEAGNGDAIQDAGTDDAGVVDPDETVPQRQPASGVEELKARADAMCAARRCADALPLYDELVNAAPSNAGFLNKRGLCRVRCGRVAESIQDYDQAIALDPNFAVAYNNRGSAYHRMDRPADAIPDFDRALELEPGYAMAYINRGGAYLAKGESERAVSDMTRGIDLKPDDPTGYPDRAAAYALLKRTDDAIADLHTALQLNPDYGPAYVNLGILLFNRGDVDEGLAVLDKGAALGESEARKAADRVRAHLKKGAG